MSGLTKDLHAYLISHMYSVDYSLRQNGHWVMDEAWWNEIRRLANPDGALVWCPHPQDAAMDVLFGLPVVVSPQYGIPRLAGPGFPAMGEWYPILRYT